jgi:hypothetical protein
MTAMRRLSRRRTRAALVAGGVALLTALAGCGSATTAGDRSARTTAATATSSAASSSAATSTAATSSAATTTNSSAASSQNANGNGSYLGHFSNGIIYVVWTNTGGGLTGTLYTDLIQSNSDGTETVDPENTTLTGTVNGSSVSLSLDSGGANLSGTLQGGTLELLNYPGATSGSLIEVTLQRTSTSGYETALTRLQNQVEGSNASVEQQQSDQATASQDQSAASAVMGDMTQLTSDAQQAVSQDRSGLYKKDLDQERADLATTIDETTHVLNERGTADSGTICDDDGTVQDDVGTVEDDVGTIQDDQGTASNVTASITDDLQQLGSDDAALEADRTSSPSFIPADAPTQADVRAAIGTGKAVLSQVNAASSAAIATANALYGQAQQSQKQADSACSESEAG